MVVVDIGGGGGDGVLVGWRLQTGRKDSPWKLNALVHACIPALKELSYAARL